MTARKNVWKMASLFPVLKKKEKKKPEEAVCILFRLCSNTSCLCIQMTISILKLLRKNYKESNNFNDCYSVIVCETWLVTLKYDSYIDWWHYYYFDDVLVMIWYWHCAKRGSWRESVFWASWPALPVRYVIDDITIVVRLLLMHSAAFRRHGWKETVAENLMPEACPLENCCLWWPDCYDVLKVTVPKLIVVTVCSYDAIRDALIPEFVILMFYLYYSDDTDGRYYSRRRPVLQLMTDNWR